MDFFNDNYFNTLPDEDKLVCYDNRITQLSEILEAAEGNPYSRISQETVYEYKRELKLLQQRRKLLYERMSVLSNREKPSSKPSFIHIAPGAKVKGLTMRGNMMIGDADFLNNDGELEDASLDSNKHIIPKMPQEEKVGIDWQKWGTIVGIVSIAVAIIIAIL